MSVAAHLKIRLEDYDRRIRTFIPGYADLLAATAGACAVALRGRQRPGIVDLGIGTGALAARCLALAPGASLVGIDSDAAILRAAMKRLARRPNPITLVHGDLAAVPLPRADAIVATLALHHVRSARAKGALYARCFTALSRGGILVSGDCHPAGAAPFAAAGMGAWVAHMRRHYSAAETRRFLAAWASEDTYLPLDRELALLQRAGFRTDVAWRRGAFAVVVGIKRERRSSGTG